MSHPGFDFYVKCVYILGIAFATWRTLHAYKMEQTMLRAKDAFLEWRMRNPGVYVGLSDTGCRLLTELIVSYDRFVDAHSFWSNESYREYYEALFGDVPPDAPKDMPFQKGAHKTGALFFFLVYLFSYATTKNTLSGNYSA